jgi:hypothetical protein
MLSRNALEDAAPFAFGFALAAAIGSYAFLKVMVAR